MCFWLRSFSWKRVTLVSMACQVSLEIHEALRFSRAGGLGMYLQSSAKMESYHIIVLGGHSGSHVRRLRYC